jgi:hypothetical protein
VQQSATSANCQEKLDAAEEQSRLCKLGKSKENLAIPRWWATLEHDEISMSFRIEGN